MHDRHMHPGQEPGSPRSANLTLDKLDEALSNLEQRMGINSAARTSRPTRHRDDDISAIRARQEALARRDDYAAAYRPAPQAGYAPMQYDPSVIHSELAGMREQLNREMATTVAAQFSGIREELKALYQQAGSVSPEDLADGFSRVTRELGVVASRVENNDMGALRSEVDELKGQISALAREDTLRDMAERWSVIEREIGSLPQVLSTREDLTVVSDRIVELGEALHSLPNSQSITAMEDQMRALAGAVEGLASQNAALSPDHLHAIEGRLDEITRAIVSASVSAMPAEIDTAPFERIEARLTSLSRQVEERSGDAQSDKVEQRLMEIAARLDVMHESTAAGALPNAAFDAVVQRLDELAQRIDAAPGQAAAMPAGMLDNLDARFEDISRRLETHHHTVEERGQQMFQSLDRRMEDLARQIEDTERDSAVVPTFDHMERRIEEIAQMLTTGDGLSPVAPAQPDSRVLEGLESQITALSEKLSSIVVPSADHAPMADLAPRLAAISDQLATGREDMIAMAREAAEEVVAKFSSGASNEQKSMLSQLAGDLRSLEELARNSDDRNTRTFEAIHDTLVKVAERIAGLEISLRSGDVAAEPMPQPAPLAAEPQSREPVRPAEPVMTPAAPEPMPHIDDAPPLDFAAGQEPRAKSPARRVASQGISPAEAAAMAARAALDKESGAAESVEAVAIDAEAPRKDQKGFLSGLRTAIMRSGKEDDSDQVDDAEPAVFGKDSKPAAALELSDEPLEPGSGAPDLAEIMKRVRAERAGPASDATADEAVDDAGKSDFIAAARRAARAAADDASVIERRTGRTDSKLSGKAGLLASRRRPIMVAAGAILLALMAFPLARGYLLDRGGAPAELAGTGSVDPVEMQAPAAETVSDAEFAASEPIADTPRVVDAAAPEIAAAMPAVPDMDAAPEAATVPETDVAALDAAETPSEISADAIVADPSVQSFELAGIPDEIGPVALREAAAEGDPAALFVVGDRVMGTGSDATGGDAAAAIRWYEASAELGYAPAQYRLGNAFEKGTGVERDIAAAKTWYRLAAEQGNISAMHNLAVLHATEIDGERDLAAATRWFQEAADHGVTDSQVNLGILSARGEGLPQDLAESYKWLSLAAKAGDKDAGAKRDEVAGFMRPDQLETARAAVELWKAKPVEVASNAIDVPDEWTTGREMTAAAPVNNGDMKKAIRNIQAILNNNGFDAGPADGVMGSRTRTAIIEFQKANDLLPTGEVDRALVDKLLEVNQQS